MIKITDEKTLVGIAELRKEASNLTRDLKITTVIVMRRGKPVGVLEDYEGYQAKESMIDEFEDLVLGHLAKERAVKAKKGDYIPLEKAAKRLNISL